MLTYDATISRNHSGNVLSGLCSTDLYSTRWPSMVCGRSECAFMTLSTVPCGVFTRSYISRSLPVACSTGIISIHAPMGSSSSTRAGGRRARESSAGRIDAARRLGVEAPHHRLERGHRDAVEIGADGHPSVALQAARPPRAMARAAE